MMDEAEAKARLRLIQIQKERQASVAPVTAPEKQGLLSRSLGRLQTGASDVLSTFSGDTYGRSGDPTQRDELGYAGRTLKALGGDIIPAVGEVASDAVIEAGKQVLPGEAQQAIGSGVKAVASSAPVQMAGKGLDMWKAAYPETYATAGELANVALAFAPVKKIPLKDFGAGKRLAKATAKTRTKEIANVFEPAKPLTGKIPAGDYIEKPGLLRKTEFVPNKAHQEMLDEIAAVPGVDPRRSAVVNRNAIQDSINNIESSLAAKLEGQAPIPRDKVLAAIDDAKDKIMQSPNIVGDAEVAARKMSDALDNLIDSKVQGGGITPKDLLAVRREIDSLVPKESLTPGNTAGKLTTKHLRTSLNDLIDASVPGTKSDLLQQHRLIKAKTYLAKVAEGEGKNRFTRALDTLERRTGVKHAVNPISGARTITDLGAMMYTGALALLTGGAKGVGEGLARNSAASQRMIATALRNSPEIAAKGVVIDAANRKKKEGE